MKEHPQHDCTGERLYCFMCLHFRRYMDNDPDSDYYGEPAYECKYDDGVSPEDEIAGCPHFKSDYEHE